MRCRDCGAETHSSYLYCDTCASGVDGSTEANVSPEIFYQLTIFSALTVYTLLFISIYYGYLPALATAALPFTVSLAALFLDLNNSEATVFGLSRWAMLLMTATLYPVAVPLYVYARGSAAR